MTAAYRLKFFSSLWPCLLTTSPFYSLSWFLGCFDFCRRRWPLLFWWMLELACWPWPLLFCQL
jgi:hypothetical protein